MTHDELLAEIDWISSLQTEGRDSLASINASIPATVKALRAVVELHKPLYYRKGEIETKGAHCDECSKGSHGENAVEYPCPTIQAIEKELG